MPYSAQPIGPNSVCLSMVSRIITPDISIGLGLDVYLLRVWCPSRILSDPAAFEDLQRHAGMFDIVGKSCRKVRLLSKIFPGNS